MTTTYRKTATIEAIQWFKMGDHPAVVMKSDPNRYADEGIPWCPTMEGGHVVTPGDWIATGIKGEHWPIKPDVFAETYTPVDAALSTPATEPQGLVENDTIDSFCLTLRRLVSDAYAERDRFGHIAATIRINALHHGATNAEVEAMLSGEISFINWIADKVEARHAATPAHSDKIAEAARKCVALLDGLVAESGRGIDYGEEDAFRMGEWFEDADLAAIEELRALAGQGDTP